MKWQYVSLKWVGLLAKVQTASKANLHFYLYKSMQLQLNCPMFIMYKCKINTYINRKSVYFAPQIMNISLEMLESCLNRRLSALYVTQQTDS